MQADRRAARPMAEMLCAMLKKTSNTVVVMASLLIGLTVLDLAQPWADRVTHLWFITLGVQIGLYANQLVDVSARRYFGARTSSRMRDTGAANPTVARTLMVWALKTALWVVLLLAVLSNLGINISAFVASLGIGGIAVALAVQNILGDLFASLSIAVDKPFEVGDAISVNGFSGTVEQVGLKTTRIRADSGEQIVIANADLLKNTVRNFKRMSNRRVQFSLNLSPSTAVDVAERVPEALQHVVEAQRQVRFDRAHLKSVTQDALEFEVVYYVLDPSYGTYMDVQQQVLLGAMRVLAGIGASTAKASQRVVVDGQGPLRPATPLRSMPKP
ncbi:mechanosensitive ion channel [Duganella ginsengisoli]|uniref:Mechanosensitive ion channel n=2 Tax=Pseudoduganella ginsengisoli TaxID=1462440 RepID=A0A6L6PVP2_9BURK|nr:mechanosensitive ion channel [Pseudoduganella ginsengisoli]